MTHHSSGLIAAAIGEFTEDLEEEPVSFCQTMAYWGVFADTLY